jgi:hypothetical protein
MLQRRDLDRQSAPLFVASRQRRADVIPKEFGAALRAEMEEIAAEAKSQTPVDTGRLRSTLRAEGPFQDGNKISAAVVAGGDDAPFAVVVYEDLDAEHAVGNAKFLERPLMENASEVLPGVAGRVKL